MTVFTPLPLLITLVLGGESVTTITDSPDKRLKPLVQMWANFRRAVLVAVTGAIAGVEVEVERAER
jgi:hypothetical protein